MVKTVMAWRPRVFVVSEAGKAITIEDLILPARAVEVVSERGIWDSVRLG